MEGKEVGPSCPSEESAVGGTKEGTSGRDTRDEPVEEKYLLAMGYICDSLSECLSSGSCG